MPIPPHVQESIDRLMTMRDMLRCELEHRRITGLKMDGSMLGWSDAELVSYEQWYVDKIDAVLAPYEGVEP